MKQAKQMTHTKCSLRCAEFTEAPYEYVAGNTEGGLLCQFSLSLEMWKSSPFLLPPFIRPPAHYITTSTTYAI
jgi:hypothetical protein